MSILCQVGTRETYAELHYDFSGIYLFGTREKPLILNVCILTLKNFENGEARNF